MENYPVPQFLERESKITFFLSFRQFYYLTGAGLICFFLYYLLPRQLFYGLSILIFLTAIAFAFVTINGVPLPTLLLGTIGFATKTKNYVWKKKESPYIFKPIQRAHIKKLEEKSVLTTQSTQLKKIQTKIETKGNY